MLGNSLMIAKHSHRQLRFILRPLKIVHHSCEYTKRCKTFVLMFVLYIPIIWTAFGLFRIVCMSAILKRLDGTTKTHATNERHRTTYAKGRASLKNSDRKVLISARLPTVKEVLNTVMELLY